MGPTFRKEFWRHCRIAVLILYLMGFHGEVNAKFSMRTPWDFMETPWDFIKFHGVPVENFTFISPIESHRV